MSTTPLMGSTEDLEQRAASIPTRPQPVPQSEPQTPIMAPPTLGQQIFQHTANIHNPMARTAARIGGIIAAGIAEGTPAGQKMMELQLAGQESQQKLRQQEEEHQQNLMQRQEVHDQTMAMQKELQTMKGEQQENLQGTKGQQQENLQGIKGQQATDLEKLKAALHEAILSDRPDQTAWKGYLDKNNGDPVAAWQQYKKDSRPVDPLLSSLKQQELQDKLDDTAATNAATSARASAGINAQENYRNTYHAWQKTGNFAADSGLITEQLGESGSGLKNSVSEGLGLLTRDPAVAVGAAAAGAAISTVSKTIDGYMDTLKKSGISPEGYAAMMAYRNALVGRLVFEAGQMKGSASVLRLREVADQFLKQVPVPTTPKESFDYSMDLYVPAMKQQMSVLEKKRGGAVTPTPNRPNGVPAAAIWNERAKQWQLP